MPFTVTIKTPTLPSKIRGDGPKKIFIREMTRAANEMAIRLRADFIKISPIGATSLLRTSWQTRPAQISGSSVKARVSSTQIQALVWDKGARPHRPPPDALATWVRRQLNLTTKREIDSAVFTISRAIGRRGLPRPARRNLKGLFTRRARRLEKTVLRKIADRMIQRIIQSLDF